MGAQTTSYADATDLVVIGGGLAGLSAAAVAGRAGRRVTVLEKAGDLGGRAATRELEGFAFNIGPHALYASGAAMRVFRELGIEPRGKRPPTAGAHAIRRGVKHALPGGFFSLLSTGLLTLPGKLELARLLSRVQTLDPEPLRSVPVADGLARLARRDEVRELLAALFRVTTYGNAPALQSTGASLAQMQSGLRDGVLYLDDGWTQLVGALRAAATAAGARLETGARAERVELSSEGAVTGVRLADGRLLPCSAAVLAVAPDEATALLGGAPHAAVARWAREAVPVQAACLDVALRRLPEPRSTFALGIDRPLYLSVHSATARLAPEGGALIHVAKYLEAGAAADAAGDRRELEGLLDLVQPGWQNELVHARFLPHLVVSNAVVTAAQGGTAGRPGPEVPGARGLYVAGDWVGPEGMLADASVASARRAVELCLRDVPPLRVAA